MALKNKHNFVQENLYFVIWCSFCKLIFCQKKNENYANLFAIFII